MQENELHITKYVDVIKQKGGFLEQKGFEIVNISDYTVRYLNNDICLVQIYYGRYSESAEVYIRFENGLSKPEQYSLGWHRNMKKFELGEKNIFRKAGDKVDKLSDILSLLDYLQNNFDEVTNIELCRQTQRKIDNNFERGIW